MNPWRKRNPENPSGNRCVLMLLFDVLVELGLFLTDIGILSFRSSFFFFNCSKGEDVLGCLIHDVVCSINTYCCIRSVCVLYYRSSLMM